jgi:hypothetical protein
LRHRSLVLWVAVATLAGCGPLAGLQAVVQPPSFEVAQGHQAELRLLGPAANRPLGGASLRVWARVHNPNRLGIMLTQLDGTLFLEGQQAALVEFPLGLPLAAVQDTVIPLDVVIGFADVPHLANVLLQAATRGEASYRLDGNVGVDAGMLGQPIFGPMTFVQGMVPVLR